MSHASWLACLFNPEKLEKVANILSKQINSDKLKLKINSIAVTGISGVAIGGLLSYKTKLPLVIVRKVSEHTHSSKHVEYSDWLENLNYCIVDDLISSGDTIERIKKNIEDETEDSKLIKIYLYNGYNSTETRSFHDIPVFAII
jgi:adenine/guanine phosphoribosyltransferase-like PRPP-binding protein